MSNSQSFLQNWWSRPAGGRAVLKLAVPMIISAGSISLMTFTDRVFLMWHDQDAMTASMQAGLFFWMLVSLPCATAGYTNAFVSQYFGNQNFQRIGPIVWQGVLFSLILGPLYVLAEPFAQRAFAFSGHDPALSLMEATYLRIILWGAGAAIAAEAVGAFFYGRGRMHVVMNVNILCVFVNILLDWCWIFGHLGFPAWGLAGAAVATVLAQWIRLLILLGLMLYKDWSLDGRFNVLRGFRCDFRLMGRLLYYGLASGVQVFLDTFGFTLFVLLIGSEYFASGGLGKQAANATSIAFTLNMFTFLPIVGTGIAVTTMVGNQLGADRPELAQRAAVTALLISVAYSAFFGFLYLVIPDAFLSFFAAYGDPVEFESIRAQSTHLLRFVALYLFCDAICIIFSSAIKGAGDTWFVMLVTLAATPILPALSLFGVLFFGFGLYWCWSVLAGWVAALSIVFWLRFHQGKWKKMRVIEPELLENR